MKIPRAPKFQNISPLAWMIGASAFANVVTMAAVLYLVFGRHAVRVRGGAITAYVDGPIDVNDRTPLRVQVVPR